MTFQELMQKFVNTPYEDLVGIARSAINDVYGDMKSALGNDENVAKFMVAVIGACVGTDSKLTQLEVKFAQDVIGDSMQVGFVTAIANAYGDAEGRDLVDGVIDQMSSDAKGNLCVFCGCFLAVDETITRGEAEFMAKLMN